jgi:hypothetical protein
MYAKNLGRWNSQVGPVFARDADYNNQTSA